jgi:hypothetical protein
MYYPILFKVCPSFISIYVQFLLLSTTSNQNVSFLLGMKKKVIKIHANGYGIHYCKAADENQI